MGTEAATTWLPSGSLVPSSSLMDPEHTTNALLAVVVLAFFVERALAPLFENKRFLQATLDRSGFKEGVAAALGVGLCWVYGFDALGILLGQANSTRLGQAITGLVVAGGSKAAVKLFHDVLGIMSDASRDKARLRIDALAEEAHKGLALVVAPTSTLAMGEAGLATCRNAAAQALIAAAPLAENPAVVATRKAIEALAQQAELAFKTRSEEHTWASP